ncbi:hypothetical protein IWW50_000860 [Coemansia erecta]|nr:hypothetical protein IWW50_000860 [Coemansia erecta]
MQVFSSNLSRMGWYDIDFGWGIPEFCRTSFYETLNDFPILAGNLEQTKNKQLQVIIDKDDLNLPDYKETQCDVHFDTLKAAKYSAAVLPENAATADSFVIENSNKKIKLANIHVLRLRDNSGVALFVGVPHFVVDGTGFVEFMKRWSAVCACVNSQGVQANIPDYTASHDRLDLEINFPEKPALFDGRSESTYIPGGIRSRWIAGISPQSRGKLLTRLASLMHVNNARYYLSRQKLQALRLSIQDHVPGGQRMSDNSLIMTLVSIVTAQSLGTPHTMSLPTRILAKLRQSIGELLGIPPKLFSTVMAVNTRPRLKRYTEATRYCGNAAYTLAVPNRLENFQAPATPEMLAKVAASINDGVRDADEMHVRNFMDLFSSAPDYYMRAMFYDKQRNRMAFSSNLSRMGWYNVDFGWGIPEFVTFADGHIMPITLILPAHPSLDGYIVHTMFSKKQDAFFKESTLWTETAEIFC